MNKNEIVCFGEVLWDIIEQSGFQGELENDIGAGDAFLSAFLSGYLNGQDLATALLRACAIGSLGLPGTNPLSPPSIESKIKMKVNNRF